MQKKKKEPCSKSPGLVFVNDFNPQVIGSAYSIRLFQTEVYGP
jgi:hypothetical protein